MSSSDDMCAIHGPLYGDDICASCHWSYKDSCCFRGTCKEADGCQAPMINVKNLNDEELYQIKKDALDVIMELAHLQGLTEAEDESLSLAEARYLAAEHVLESRQLESLENDPLTVARDEVERLEQADAELQDDYEEERGSQKHFYRRMRAEGIAVTDEQRQNRDQVISDILRIWRENYKQLEEARAKLAKLEKK